MLGCCFTGSWAAVLEFIGPFWAVALEVWGNSFSFGVQVGLRFKARALLILAPNPWGLKYGPVVLRWSMLSTYPKAPK